DAHPDGTMLTEACGGGCRATRRTFLTRLAASVFGLLGLRGFAAAGPSSSPAVRRPRSLMGAPPPPPRQSPVSLQGQAIAGSPQPTPRRTMGKIAAPAVRPQPRMGEAVVPVHRPACPVHPRALLGVVARPVRSG